MSVSLDSAWVRWVNRREPQAFEELVRQYAAMVYGTCLRVLRNPTDAEDVAQECFEELVRKPDLSGVRVPGAWLHGTATYRSLTRLRSDERRKQREITYAKDLASTTPPTREELADCVDECLAELPEETRFLLVQYFLCGRSQNDIARELGIPRRTLGHRIESGLNLLGVALRKRGIVVEALALTGLLAALSSTASAAPQTLIASLGKLAMAQSARSAAATPPADASMTLSALKIPMIVAVLSIITLTGTFGFTHQNAGQQSTASSAAIATEMVETATKEATTPAPVANEAPAKPGTEPNTLIVDTNLVTVAGYVVDEDNLPATDVRIGLKRKGLYGPTADDIVPVDTEGKFVWTGLLPNTFEGNPTGEYVLYYCSDTVDNVDSSVLTFARAQILAVESPTLKLTQGQRVEGAKVVVPSARYAIDGTVRDERGKGIAGVGLTLFSGCPNAQTISDANGHFKFARLNPYCNMYPREFEEQPLDWFALQVTHPNYDRPADVNVRLGSRGVDFVLPDKRRGWISGTALDGESGKPFVGAKAWVSRVLRDDGANVYVSDEEDADILNDGTFTLWDVPSGKASVWASAPGRGPVCTTTQVKANQGTEGIEFVLNKGGRVTVTLAETPADFPSTIVWAYAYHSEGDPNVNFNGKRQEDGSFVLDLAPGQYEVVTVVDLHGRYCYTEQVNIAGGDTIAVEAGPPGTACVKGFIIPPPGDQSLSYVLRFGEHSTSVPDKYANSLSFRRGGWYLDLAKDDIFACAHCTSELEIEYLQPGTYTLTIIAYNNATEGIMQTSKSFALADDEELTLDIAF